MRTVTTWTTSTVCMFFNTADNRYFDVAERHGMSFDGLTPVEVIAQRIPYVEATRAKSREFREERVKPS